MSILILGVILSAALFVFLGFQNKTVSVSDGRGNMTQMMSREKEWKTRPIQLVALVVLLASLLFSSVTVVPTGYTGILTTFGRVENRTISAGAHLILQPQPKQDVLTQWLHDNGYRILDARLVEDEGRLYTVFVAQGGPPRPIAGPEELYVNRLLVEKRDPLLPAYTAFLMERLERAYRGLEKAAVPRPAEQARLKSILHGLKAIKQEADKW